MQLTNDEKRVVEAYRYLKQNHRHDNQFTMVVIKTRQAPPLVMKSLPVGRIDKNNKNI